MSGKILKRNKKTISLATKIEILRRCDAGEKAANISRILKLPATTVRTIRNRDAKKIRESAKNASTLISGRILKITSSLNVSMESLLSMWIEEQKQRKVPLSKAMIQEKAISIFEHLKSEPEHIHKSETFYASRGWFQKFKKRAKLHNVILKQGVASGVAHIAHDRYSLKQEKSDTDFEEIEVNDVGDSLIEVKEEIIDDQLQNFTYTTEDVTKHVEVKEEISNQKLTEAFLLIDKAMEIFINHDICNGLIMKIARQY